MNTAHTIVSWWSCARVLRTSNLEHSPPAQFVPWLSRGPIWSVNAITSRDRYLSA
jgi:hypothetical protein